MTNLTLQAVQQLIANDSYAVTFQSVEQYRTALLRHVDSLMEGPTKLPGAASAESQGERHMFESDVLDLFDGNASFQRNGGSEYLNTQVLDMWVGWSMRAAHTPAVAFANDGREPDWQDYAEAERVQQATAPGALPEHDPPKPAEQQGLFRKFDVRRTDGSDQPGGKHHGCRYYVLDLTHDRHSPAAMRAYAAACAVTHPLLAADIVAEFGALDDDERAKWTTKQWYEHVGAWETPEGYIAFGSVMALGAMLIQFQRAHRHPAAPSAPGTPEALKGGA